MTTNQTLADYIRTLKNMERRLRQIERKLMETDDKLDHIMFRLIEEDAESRSQHRFLENRNSHSSPNGNDTNGSC